MRVAFDIGGTFTDVVLMSRDGRVRTAKLLSILEGVGTKISEFIDRMDGSFVVDSILHATTVCSNALIERTLPRVAFVTTKGFGCLLEIMDQRGAPTNELDWERQLPLVPRHLCFEVDERIAGSGAVDRELNVAAMHQLVRTMLIPAEPEAIAVCLINSYANNSHERKVAEILASKMPGVPVILSSDIDPELHEYDRASTTVINASLVPVVRAYLDRLESDLSGFGTGVRVMQSNGGTMSSEIARQRPMTMVESGPAAGVLAAAALARELGHERVLSFDMGGTTAKTCLIEQGQPLEHSRCEVGGSLGTVRLKKGQGYPLRTSSLDIVEVGAGGGSIAWIDPSGALRVGPEGAGAEPGPACYARGGDRPTVTDANVLLGFINPDQIADSTLPLDREAAERAVRSHIAEPLGMSVLDAASGIIDVANVTMTRAIRAVSSQRGRDLREMALIAFGGGGPLHAVALCERVGIETVLIPAVPGVFSALGLLLAGDRLDYVYSIEAPLPSVTQNDLDRAYLFLMQGAEPDFTGMGLSADDVAIECSLDVRYGFEPTEINIPIQRHQFDVRAVAEEFARAHEQEFGAAGVGDVHLSRFRLRIRSVDHGSFDGMTPWHTPETLGPGPADLSASRFAYFGRALGGMETRVMSRSQVVGLETGPLVIEEETSTCVIPPGWMVRLGPSQTLLIERVKAKS